MEFASRDKENSKVTGCGKCAVILTAMKWSMIEWNVCTINIFLSGQVNHPFRRKANKILFTRKLTKTQFSNNDPILCFFVKFDDPISCFFQIIGFCVNLIDFLPIIKQIPQFLIKGELFFERERGERDIYANPVNLGGFVC